MTFSASPKLDIKEQRHIGTKYLKVERNSSNKGTKE
jgi:hypothetical protein